MIHFPLCQYVPAPSRSSITRASATSVTIQAETLYEAVALALAAFGEHHCLPGPGSTMEVEARSPAVTHTVSVAKVRDWLGASAKSPREKIIKDRLKGMMAS
ncbi:MAG: hypothetical protein WA213_18875 [Terriglobales bacterium]